MLYNENGLGHISVNLSDLVTLREVLRNQCEEGFCNISYNNATEGWMEPCGSISSPSAASCLLFVTASLGVLHDCLEPTFLQNIVVWRG